MRLNLAHKLGTGSTLSPIECSTQWLPRYSCGGLRVRRTTNDVYSVEEDTSGWTALSGFLRGLFARLNVEHRTVRSQGLNCGAELAD